VPLALAYNQLKARVEGKVRRNEPMARHTTFRIGGPAAIFVECDSLSDLHAATDVLSEQHVAWTVLGKGSNVLVSDDGYGGAVLVLGRAFRSHSVDENRLNAGGGVLLARLVQAAFSVGLSGLEFAVGIPGTVGGALGMNAGSRDVWIDGITESVTVFRPGAGLQRLRGSDIVWGYRRSDLSSLGVVVETTLRLEEGDRDRIRLSMEASLERRKRSQPLSLPSAGSVFVNPPNDSAGRLIESAGLKGERFGGAAFSEVHANFIVNLGGATASDVVALMMVAQERVADAHGVELTPEVRFLGSFDEP
jgi:UDP-N-acetylmuramate dehydrogenase